jgi:hypothetical protein
MGEEVCFEVAEAGTAGLAERGGGDAVEDIGGDGGGVLQLAAGCFTPRARTRVAAAQPGPPIVFSAWEAKACSRAWVWSPS